jgi:hypothetical protein
MARTGLRMMPTFPSSSLKFRTAGFPQYGFKAGVSGGAFPFPANEMIAVSGLPPPFVLLALHILCPALCRGIWRVETPPFEWLRPLYPRGPRSGPGYSVPVHPHLIDPIRPTGGHIGTSPLCGLYPLPSLCAKPRRLGDPPLVPCFRWLSFIGMSSSGTTGSPSIACTQFLHRRRWPSTRVYGLGTSNIPHPPILVGRGFSRLYYGSLSLRPADLLVLLSELTRLSPSQQGLLRPGFRRISRPLRRRISLQGQLGKFPRRDLHPLERQLASLQQAQTFYGLDEGRLQI